mgnify:CR=1 FL=1
MKKGFTMIELIFVIVILGVLASVAIPRLAATRDDAEVAKAATNLATAVSDIAAYYTAKGSFTLKTNGTDTTKTTKVDFSDITNALDNDGNLKMKNETCATVYLPGVTGANISSGEVKLEIRFTGTDAACKTLQSLSSIQTLCGGASEKKYGSKSEKVTNCFVQIGGSGGIAW